MSAFGMTRYGQKFGVAVRAAGTRISDKLMEVTDRLATELFELGTCQGLEKNYQFLYPFVGGTQVAHSFNLADPSKYRIQFEDDTTVTHDANGITGPGNVQLFPFESSTMIQPPQPPPPAPPVGLQPGPPTLSDCCCAFGIYCRSGVSADTYDLIADSSTTSNFAVHAIACRRATWGDSVYHNGINNTTGYIAVLNSNPQGFYTSMRHPSNATHAYKNGVNIGGLGSGQAVNAATFYLLSGNSHNLAYCFLSKNFDINGIPYSGEMQATMYQVVQKFQTACGRQV